ncbi:hypothetical protein L798_13868 [Zootermopsis nevadensis]|uniref:Uncharacterized protein n=1 Tax=Zootermopsis nevadensis TaxID=136037 RepID=A0A067R2Q5_ZOONE|nr:hypothetical protein L798_13868 [Zootermopsis nevadensis]
MKCDIGVPEFGWPMKSLWAACLWSQIEQFCHMVLCCWIMATPPLQSPPSNEQVKKTNESL